MNFILAKSGNAWLRHLKKTPRESAFSRVIHGGFGFIPRSFSNSSRRVDGRCVRGVVHPCRFNSQFAFSFLSPFLFNLRIFTIYFRSTDLESLIRIHSRTPFLQPFFLTLFFLHRTSFNGSKHSLNSKATKWIVSRRGGK